MVLASALSRPYGMRSQLSLGVRQHTDIAMASGLSTKQRLARALYIYVTMLCALLSLALPWADLTRAEFVALARLLLFLTGGIAGWIGISRGRPPWRYVAAGAGAVALVEFLARLPTLLRHYDVAVANASWFGFLSANSIFVALILAGYLSLTGARPPRDGDSRSAV
jgi:hypothetical protein